MNVEADHKTITVKNTGSKYSGKEVVQVYVNGHIHKPFQVLVGFGKSEEVIVQCSLHHCASYCEEHLRWILEEGTYIVRVGNSSRTTSVASKIEHLKNF